MTYLSEVLADSPMAYYRLNEPTGNALDQIGGRHLGLTGTVTRQAPSLLVGDGDTAVLFSNGIFERVNFSDFGMSTPLYTAECWFRATGIPSAGTFPALMNHRDGGLHNRWQMYTYNNGGAMALNLEHVNAPGTSSTTSATVGFSGISAGVTHHVVCSNDGSALRLYLDGVQVATNPAGAAGTGVAPPIRVGKQTGTNQPFSGTIDEVAYYGTALSAARVLVHYQAGLGIYAGSYGWGLQLV